MVLLTISTRGRTMAAQKTIGILTSGGDAPGLNAAIRGVARTAIEQFNMNVIGIEQGYRGLIQGNAHPLTSEIFPGLLTKGGTILGTSREKPFKKDKNQKYDLNPVDAIKQNYDKWNLDALVVLGGNGTNTTASLLAKEGLNVIGLPKTIDNDIVKTDVTFGFHTAVEVATDAIDRIHTTAHSHSRIMVVELMGHKAGWLALYAGIAAGGDVILLPEIPYDIQSVANHILMRKESGKNFSIVVVAEGALSVAESCLEKKALKKLRQNSNLSIGYQVAKELEKATNLESRVSVLGYLQRGGTPIAYDRVLATEMGVEAANMIHKKEFGKMVALQNEQLVGVPLDEIAGKIKNVPLNHHLIKAGIDVGTNFGNIL